MMIHSEKNSGISEKKSGKKIVSGWSCSSTSNVNQPLLGSHSSESEMKVPPFAALKSNAAESALKSDAAEKKAPLFAVLKSDAADNAAGKKIVPSGLYKPFKHGPVTSEKAPLFAVLKSNATEDAAEKKNVLSCLSKPSKHGPVTSEKIVIALSCGETTYYWILQYEHLLHAIKNLCVKRSVFCHVGSAGSLSGSSPSLVSDARYLGKSHNLKRELVYADAESSVSGGCAMSLDGSFPPPLPLWFMSDDDLIPVYIKTGADAALLQVAVVPRAQFLSVSNFAEFTPIVREIVERNLGYTLTGYSVLYECAFEQHQFSYGFYSLPCHHGQAVINLSRVVVTRE